MLLRLFSIVDTKQKNPLFLFSFFVKPFSIVTQNKKWGQNFYVLGFWNIERGQNLFQRRGETQNTKLLMGRRGEGWRAAVEGLNGKVIDFNEIFSKTYSFVYFEIFCIVEATYSENMKPMCRFNQLWNLEEAYFSAYLFEIWPDQRVFFFHVFLLKIYIDCIYFTKYFYLSRSWIQSNSPYPGSVCIVVPSQHPGKRPGPQHRVISPIILLNFWTSD